MVATTAATTTQGIHSATDSVEHILVLGSTLFYKSLNSLQGLSLFGMKIRNMRNKSNLRNSFQILTPNLNQQEVQKVGKLRR